MGRQGHTGSKGNEGDKGYKGDLRLSTVFRNPIRLVGGYRYQGLYFITGRVADPNRGRVEIQNDGVWGTVCDDGWDINDAIVVCRQLGLATATQAYQSARYWQGSGNIWMDSVDCSGDENHLAQCSFMGWGNHDCNHDEDASVVCGGSIFGK